MQIQGIKALLEQTYWANVRDIITIKKSIDNSLCYGAFLKESGKQIGFSRVITDYATTFYICDMIVDEHYRGMGIGKIIVNDYVGRINNGVYTGSMHCKRNNCLHKNSYNTRDEVA